MIKAVIIDDEINSRELLMNMLGRYCPDIQLVGQADDVPSGIVMIRKTTPDVVFLDIEMPGGDGFAILDDFSEIHFKIIFVTGYDQYAIKAIKYAALDYLLKPVEQNELKSAVEKIQTNLPDQSAKLDFLHQVREDQTLLQNQILLPDHQGYHVIRFEEIIRIEAQGNYVQFFLKTGKSTLSSYPMNYYEELLPENQFYRIHKSHIINLHHINRIDSGRGGYVHMSDGGILEIAYRRKAAFKQMVGKYRK